MMWESWIESKLLGKYFLRYALVGFLIFLWVLKREKKEIWYSLKKEKKQLFWQVLKLLLFSAFIHFALKYLFSLIAPSRISNKAEKINTLIKIISDSKENFWIIPQAIFGLCVLAPIFEECIFRHFIFTIFGKKSPFSYLFSFFTFILAHYHHGENITILFLQYSVASFAIIYIYKKSNWKLLAPILLHSLINLLFISLTLINSNSFLI